MKRSIVEVKNLPGGSEEEGGWLGGLRETGMSKEEVEILAEGTGEVGRLEGGFGEVGRSIRLKIPLTKKCGRLKVNTMNDCRSVLSAPSHALLSVCQRLLLESVHNVMQCNGRSGRISLP